MVRYRVCGGVTWGQGFGAEMTIRKKFELRLTEDGRTT